MKDKFYYKDGTTSSEHSTSKHLHREGGPAVERADGGKRWYIDGKLHREDGPALEYNDGAKFWYIDNKRHRLDGPACEWADGDKEWRIDDKYYTEENFNKLIEEVKQLPKVLRLIDTREWVRNYEG